MARITIEDCLEKVSNRFELVLIASERVKQLNKGMEPLVSPENEKNTIIALREIANGNIQIEDAEELVVQNFQKEIPKEQRNNEIPISDGFGSPLSEEDAAEKESDLKRALEHNANFKSN